MPEEEIKNKDHFIRVKHDLYVRLSAIALADDRKPNKMAAILIEKGVQEKETEGQSA